MAACSFARFNIFDAKLTILAAILAFSLRQGDLALQCPLAILGCSLFFLGNLQPIWDHSRQCGGAAGGSLASPLHKTLLYELLSRRRTNTHSAAALGEEKVKDSQLQLGSRPVRLFRTD